jgi:hypothetical protein
LRSWRASEWCEQKYGTKVTQTPWRKMHLSIDADMNVHAIRITIAEVSDSEVIDAALPADVPLERVIADGAYYSIDGGRGARRLHSPRPGSSRTSCDSSFIQEERHCPTSTNRDRSAASPPK